MSQSLQRVVQSMMTTAASLSALHSGEAVERVAADLLGAVIRADEVLLTRLDLNGTTTRVHLGPSLKLDKNLSRDLSRVGHTHPAVLSYLTPGDDGRPRRVSDVASQQAWRSSDAFQEVFRDRPGNYQLSLVTRLQGATGTGWVLTRAHRDFTADDVVAAHVMLPMLTTLTELAEAKSVQGGDPECALTSREMAVLSLLATGRSARGIARDLGMTEGTARKHLSHIYTKLGVHDRLSAVLCLQRETQGPGLD